MADLGKPVGQMVDKAGNPTFDWQTFFDRLATDSALCLLQPYAKANLPTANVQAGAMIYVSDEAGGAVPAFFDGTNWCRVTDRAVVS
jgi:hypothetical protein